MLPSKPRPGEPVRADTIGKIIDEVSIVSKITGGKGIGVVRTRSGVVVYNKGSDDNTSAKFPVGQYVGQGWFTVSNNVSAMAYPFAVQTV